MLINHRPDTFEKLAILGGMASDDILSARDAPPSPNPMNAGPATPRRGPARNPVPGVYRAAMPNGKFINLMRVMFTDFCKMDCFYCPNSHWVPRKRFAFTVDELANAFMELRQRHAVDGLFLSSGIAGTASKTTQKLLDVVEVIRRKHGFTGYIHMKVMPGTDRELVEAAHGLGTRLSVNLETPTDEMMRRISTMKDLERDILDPMRWVHEMNRESTGGVVGQATQLVVGAANESDRDIFQRIDQLYGELDLKRVYYSAFRPVRYTPLEEHPGVPMAREHRLYQMDWLKRIYRFSSQEISQAFDADGYLDLHRDPKTAIAVENADAFPVDVNTATREQLLRVPGVGPTSTDRILKARREHAIDTWRDLQAMGVVRKRAWPFLAFPGQRPPTARQIRLDLFGERQPSETAAPALRQAQGERGTTPCGVGSTCAGCSLYGAPGHPGAPEAAAMGAAA